MISQFFIRRPIFATVISIVIVIGGLVALRALPVARYPEISPPTISVTAVYPGADARTVAETVAATIEKEVNGVEGMIYMSSVCGNDGSMSLTVTFEPGTDLDIANVLVQNRVAVAQARLPEEVKRQGVTVKKKSTDVVMYVAFHAVDGTLDDAFLSNYVTLRVRDEVARVRGVGDVGIFGAGEYSMRIWLDPQRLRALDLSGADVIAAIRAQNVQVAAGRVGATPAPEGTAFEFVLSTQGRLVETSEFENIVVRATPEGRLIRVRDVARVELGAEFYRFTSRFNGKPSTTLAVYQVPGSNLIEVADGTREKLEELKSAFPSGMDYEVVFDSTDVINASIREVIGTLIASLILVVLTVYVFLQNFRATLIPAITIPVSLIGTFAVMLVLGFSINQLTLFGLVLVIGIVVDDAIVVVENTFTHLNRGLSPKEAASTAMKEVAGPVVATTLVLLAVFVPTMFMGGITGSLFKQFAVTISIATIFSSINALTLSPALCGILLSAQTREPRGFFRFFNVALEKSTNGYLRVVRMAVRRAAIGVILFIGLAAIALWGLGRLPTGFVPQEDEGYCFVAIQLPDGSTKERTDAVVEKVNAILEKTEGIENRISISGYSLLDGAASENTAFCVATFTPWDDRPGDDLHQAAIIQNLNRQLAGIQEAVSFALAAPSLPGVGISAGFTYMLQDRGGGGLEELQRIAEEVIRDSSTQSGLVGLSTTFRAGVPQLFVDIDREQVMKSGTSMREVFDTLQVNLGSAYVNDFTLFGRIFKVTVQADQDFRATPADIEKLPIRSSNGQMVPLGAVAKVRETLGPQTVTRFNLYPAVRILGRSAPGYSSGQAIDIMEDMSAKKLPPSMGFNWSELSYQEKAAGGSAGVFLFAVIMVYLVLAAQYESWSLPISVVLAVPTALLGAVFGVTVMGMDNNVYTQIGIVLLIGLSTKSAILIVEFAKAEREAGKSIFDAAVSATKLRFRAVLMTAFSFILGVIPLLIASGAGAESRKVIGAVVFYGMLLATVVSLAAVPMLYYVVQSLTEALSRKKRGAAKDGPGPVEATET